MSLSGSSDFEMEQLGDRQVGDLIVDRCAEEDDPLAEQVRVDVGSPLSRRVLLDHHRDERAHARWGRAGVEEVGFSFSNSANPTTDENPGGTPSSGRRRTPTQVAPRQASRVAVA